MPLRSTSDQEKKRNSQCTCTSITLAEFEIESVLQNVRCHTFPHSRHFPSPTASNPAHPLKNRLRLIRSHTTDPQSPNLRPPPQPLQSNSHFPALFLLQNKKISFTLLVSNTRSQDMQALIFTTLLRSTEVRSCLGRRESRTRRATRLASTPEPLDQRVGLFGRRGLGRSTFRSEEGRPTSSSTSSSRRRITRRRTGARTRSQSLKTGTPYLDQFHRPSLDVPFPLGDASHIIVDEESLRRDPEDQPVRDRAHA